MLDSRWVRPLIAAGMFAGLSIGTVDAATTAKVKDAWGDEVTVQGYDSAKNPGSQWFVHDATRPQPPRADEKDIKPALGVKAPEGAVSIFDGKTLHADAKWKVEDGVATISGGGLTSKESFGSAHFHIEWASPKEVKGAGQGRGNSGIIIMGKYEVQVLDAWKNPTYADGMAGSVYGQNPPKFNAAVKPGEWNSYDIEWHAPKFDDKKNLVKPARVTVVWNGVKVQDNYELVGVVQHQNATKYQYHEAKLPLQIQDHGDKVMFKNIWVKPIDD
jgi:hypothetical protein